jgi:hypothetical protein
MIYSIENKRDTLSLTLQYYLGTTFAEHNVYLKTRTALKKQINKNIRNLPMVHVYMQFKLFG